MAVSREDLIIAIEAQMGKTVENLEKITKKLDGMSDSLDNANKASVKSAKAVTDTGASFVKLSSAIDVAKAAYEAFKFVMDKTVGAYNEQIDSERRLAVAMASRGKFSDEALDRFREFANQMQANTTLGDDQVLNLAAQASALGIAEEQVQKLIKASAGLASVNGKDVNTNFQMLLKTYKGVAGASEVLDKEIGNLTQAELKNGKAVEMMAEKYGKFAEEEGKTMAGQITQLKNAFGDLSETIGEVVAKTLNLDESTGLLKKAVQSLQGFIADNKMEFIVWGKVMLSIVDDISLVFTAAGAIITGVATNILKRLNQVIYGVQVGLNAMGAVSDEAVANTEARLKGLEDFAQSTVDVFHGAVASLGDLNDSGFENFSTSIDDVTASAKKMQDAFKGTKQDVQVLSDNGKKMLEELAKVVDDLTAKTSQIGVGRADLLKAQAEAQFKQINLLEEKLKKEDSLTGEAQKQLATARELINLQMNQTLSDEKRKLNEDLLRGNEDQMFQLQQYGKLQQDIIENTMKHQISLINLKEKELEKEGLISDAIRERFAEQRAIVAQQASNASNEAMPREMEAPLQAGTKIAGMISGSFAGLAGMAGGVGAVVSAASAVLDFIPRIIDSITGLINKITDFPNVLLKSFQNFFASIEKFISDFIPNVINFVDGILETVVSFIERFPDMIESLLNKVPDMLLSLIDKIPVLAERLVTALVTMMPKLYSMTINFFVKNAPKLAISLMKTFYIEIPKAIINGLIEGGKQLVEMIKGALSGKGFKAPKLFDPKAIEKDLQKVMKGLTGQASQLFSVQDLGEAVKNQKLAKGLTDGINDAGKKARNWLLEAWNYILDRLNAFVSFLKDTWMNLINMLKSVWDGIVLALQMLWSAIKTIFETLATAFNNFIGAFRGLISQLQGLFANFKKFGAEMWQGFVDLAGQAGGFFRNMGSNIWSGLQDGLNSAWGMFSNIGSTIWGSLYGGLSNIGGIFQNALNAINPAQILERVFKVDGRGRGTVENILGVDVPFANFAQGGIVPGNAVVPGDSFANDRILALVSPDEAVIPRSKMNNPAIRKIVEGILDGSFMPPRFKNGYVDKVTGGGGGWGNPLGGLGAAAGAVWDSIAGAAQGALGPIASTMVQYLNVDQIKSLGDAINNGSLPKELQNVAIGQISGAAGATFGNAMKIRDAAASYAAMLERIGKNAYTTGRNTVNTAINTVKNPKEAMWDRVRSEGRKALEMFLATNTPLSQFHDGGFVNGSGDVPAMLQDGEFVMSRKGVQAAGSERLEAYNRGEKSGSVTNHFNVELNLKIETTQPVDDNFARTKLYPIIADNLRRDSLNGRLIISQKGVF